MDLPLKIIDMSFLKFMLTLIFQKYRKIYLSVCYNWRKAKVGLKMKFHIFQTPINAFLFLYQQFYYKINKVWKWFSGSFYHTWPLEELIIFGMIRFVSKMVRFANRCLLIFGFFCKFKNHHQQLWILKMNKKTVN